MTKIGTSAGKVLYLREDWSHLLSHHCQALAGEAGISDILMVRLLAEQFLALLPRAANPVERVFLRQQLMEFSLRWGTGIHSAFHKKASPACLFNPAGLVVEVWQDRSADPMDVFASWSVRFVDDFERCHVPRLASRVRKFIDVHFADCVDIKRLAKELRCSQARAASEFRKGFGISPSQYQRRLRVWEGLRLLRATDVKVEAVARAVGYRSKKNFYQVTREETGQTPTQIRKKK